MIPFPISEKQFLSWLNTTARKKCGDIISNAVNELTEDDVMIGDKDWCYGADLAHGGTKDREYPRWVIKVISLNDKLGHDKSRAELRSKLDKSS